MKIETKYDDVKICKKCITRPHAKVLKLDHILRSVYLTGRVGLYCKLLHFSISHNPGELSDSVVSICSQLDRIF